MTWHRTSSTARGYGASWRKLREQILQRDNHVCQCGRCRGGAVRLRPASEVDHVVSKAAWLRRHGNLDNVDDPSNLQAINTDCHRLKTAEERGFEPIPATGPDGYPIEAP